MLSVLVNSRKVKPFGDNVKNETDEILDNAD